MTVQQKNVPALRFPSFVDAWESLTMKDISRINQGLQIAIAERLTEPEAGAHFYITNEFLKVNSKVKYYIKNPTKSVLCDVDDILMTRTGNTGMVVTNVAGAFHNNFFKIDYNRTIIEKYFLYYFLTSVRIQNTILRLAGTSTIPDLNHGDFYKIVIHLPVINEQQKIADFLSAVDERIQQLTRKKELLEQYKKGVMQQLFSRIIRFKTDEGNDYPDWEEKRLGEVLSYEQPTKYLVSSEEYSDKFTTPVLTAGKTFVLGFTDEEFGICENLPVIIFDDFTTANKFVDFPFKVKSSAMKILRSSQKDYNLRFLYELLQTIEFVADSHKRYWISEYQEMLVFIPGTSEQQKIADFLSGVDDKTSSVQIEIEQTQLFKKGLLQQMFV